MVICIVYKLTSEEYFYNIVNVVNVKIIRTK